LALARHQEAVEEAALHPEVHPVDLPEIAREVFPREVPRRGRVAAIYNQEPMMPESGGI